MRLQFSKGLHKMYRRPDLLNNSPIVVQIETFALSSKQNLIGYGTILHCSLNQNFRTVGGCCDKPGVDTHSNNGLFLLLLELLWLKTALSREQNTLRDFAIWLISSQK